MMTSLIMVNIPLADPSSFSLSATVIEPAVPPDQVVTTWMFNSGIDFLRSAPAFCYCTESWHQHPENHVIFSRGIWLQVVTGSLERIPPGVIIAAPTTNSVYMVFIQQSWIAPTMRFGEFEDFGDVNVNEASVALIIIFLLS